MRALATLHALPESACAGERLTWELKDSDPWTRAWRHQKFTRIPEAFSLPIAQHYHSLWESSGEPQANLYLLDVVDRLSGLTIDPRSSDGDLIALGKRIALRCRETLRTNPNHNSLAQQLLRICKRYSVRPPLGLERHIAETSHGTERAPATRLLPIGIISRLTDDVWWRRKLRIAHGRILEAEAIKLHQVHRFAGLYVSNATFNRHRQQRRRNHRALEALVATNELGEEHQLSEIVAHSLANPANRRAELMVRIYGFDQLAIELGHEALLLTVTCPARMHAHLGESGAANPMYDGETTPRTAQRYLTKLWSCIRSSWQRQRLRPYGFRITEAHHDGTPHWHILLFIEASNRQALIETVRQYALRDSPNEPGASKHRFSVQLIDRKRGSATGYVAKYISKNIDGFGLADTDGHGNANDLAQRMGAWASTWGIRQFQQIGGPPVGLWRELRRMPCLANDSNPIAELAAAADSGQWGEFVKLLGGAQVPRKSLPVRLEKVFDTRTGRYGEPLGLRVAGVTLNNVVFSTRFHTWTIKRKTTTLNCAQPASEVLRIAPPGSEFFEVAATSPPLEFCQ